MFLLAISSESGRAQVPGFGQNANQHLIALESPDDATRQVSATTLARFTRQHAVVVALERSLLEDPAVSVRRAAARALRRAGRSAKRSLARAAVCDPSAALRAELAALARAENVACHLSQPVRKSAARQPARSEAELRVGLESPLGRVRLATVRGISTKPSRRARQILWAMASQDPHWAVRRESLRVLALGYKKPMLALLRYVLRNDPDVRVRRYGIELVAYLRDRSAASLLAASAVAETDSKTQIAALEGLTRLGGGIARRLIENLTTTGSSARLRAAALRWLLGARPAPATRVLTQVLRDDKAAEMRRLAVEALSQRRAGAVLQALQYALAQDSDPLVRLKAAKALAKFSDSAAHEALRGAAARDEDPQVRHAAADAITRSPAFKSWLTGQLSRTIDDSVAVRLDAVSQICPLAQPRSYRALVRLLWLDAAMQVRRSVATCFAALDSPLIDLGLSVAYRTEAEADVRKAIERAQRARVQRQTRLLSQATTAEVGKRAEALRLLLPGPNRKVRQALEGALSRDEQARVRGIAATNVYRYADRRALRALGAASRKEADPQLRQRIKNLYQDLHQRWTSAKAAASLPTQLMLLKSGNPDQRLQAAWTLGMLRTRQAYTPLRTATRDGDPRLRYAAVVALAIFGDVKILSRAARTEQDPPTRDRLRQLNALRGAAADDVVGALRSDDRERLVLAIEAMAIRRLDAAVPFLARLTLSHLDRTVRRAAARSLVLYEDPMAYWAIRAGSSHDASPRLRRTLWSLAVLADGSSS